MNKLNRHTTLFYFAVGISLLCTYSCSSITGTKTLKLAHALDITHSVHIAMEYLAQRVDEKSGGKLKIDIYPSGQLGTERQCLELLQIGSLSMTKVSGAVMESFSPNIQVFSLPYIFRDREHSFAVMDGPVGQQLLLEGSQYWLRGLTYFDAGFRSFYTKKPINTPDDLKGLKIRVQESVTAINLVKALGGAPTPISWGELYTALQQGVVDGAENNPPSFYLSRHYEQCGYYSLNEHTAVPDILVMGTIAWDNLNTEEQQWLQEAVKEATVYQRKLWLQSEQEALEAVEAAGVQIIRPDKSLFEERTSAMLKSYESNTELQTIIEQIQQTK